MKKSLKIILIVVGVIIFLLALLAAATIHYFDEVDYTIELVKNNKDDANKFYRYFTRDEGRIVYLADNVDQVYFYENDNKQTLNDYAKTWQTLDDIVKHISYAFQEEDTLRDGGTKIYRSHDNDATMVVCNTLLGNKNIYIGEYNMEYDSNKLCRTYSDEEISKKELENIHKQIDNYFQTDGHEYNNLAHVYVDEDNKVVVVGLLVNSYEKRKEFREKVIDSEYIEFEKGYELELN